MSNGIRLQLRPVGELADGEFYYEGEPIWDALNRKIGFYNFDHQKIQWFRIPDEGENENYVPAHQWNNQSIRWRNPDGTWGPWTNLSIGSFTGFEVQTNPDRSLTLSFILTGQDGTRYTFNVDSEPLGGSDGWTPMTAIVEDGVRRVYKVVDWIPSENTDLVTKPAVNLYLGPTGYTANIAEATDVRGPIGVSTGDMTKSTYDTNNNGKVDIAQTAEAVDWSGVQNKPIVFAPDYHSADRVNSGVFDPARIPVLAPTKISGTFSTTQIPDLSATKITSGVLDVARIPDISSAKITSGTIDPARLPATVFQAPIVAPSTLASLTTSQQNDIVGGSVVVTDDGTFWIYKGTGSKTVSTSYQEMADKTPSWNVIADKPATFPATAHTHTIANITDITATGAGLLTQTSKPNVISYLGLTPGNIDQDYVDGPVAAAAITAGKVVAINETTGKIEEVTGSELSFVDPEIYGNEIGNISDISTIYDTTSKKLIIAYYNNTTGNAGVVIGQRVNGTMVYGKSIRLPGCSQPRLVQNPTTKRVALFYRASTGNLETFFVDYSGDDPVASTSAVAQESSAVTSLVAMWDSVNNKMCVISNDGSNTRARFINDDTAATPVISTSIVIVVGNYYLWSMCYSAVNNCFYVVGTSTTPSGFYVGFPLAMNGAVYQTAASPVPAWSAIGASGTGTITGNFGMTITYDPTNQKVMTAYTTGSTIIVQQSTPSSLSLSWTNSPLSVVNYGTVYRLAAVFDSVNARLVYCVGNSAGRLHFFYISSVASTSTAPSFLTPSAFCIDGNDTSSSGGGVAIASIGSGEFFVTHSMFSIVTNILRTTTSYRTDTGFAIQGSSSYENAVAYDPVNQMNICFFSDSTGIWGLGAKDDPSATDGMIVSNAYPKLGGNSQPASSIRVAYDSISGRFLMFYWYNTTLIASVFQNGTADVYSFSPTLSETGVTKISSVNNYWFDIDYDPVARLGVIYWIDTSNYPRYSVFSFDGTAITIRGNQTIVSTAVTTGSGTVVFDPNSQTFLVTCHYSSQIRLLRIQVRRDTYSPTLLSNVIYAISSGYGPKDMVYMPSLKKYAMLYGDSTNQRAVIDLIDADQAVRSIATIVLVNNGIPSASMRLCWDDTGKNLLALYTDIQGIANYNILKINDQEEFVVVQTGHIGYTLPGFSSCVLGKPVYNPTQKAFVIPYYDSLGVVNKFYKLRLAQETTNANNWIGVLRSNVALGGVPQIAPPGSVAPNQTGLTTGKQYYLKADGTLTTTKNKRPIGHAFSATRLLLEYKRELG